MEDKLKLEELKLTDEKIKHIIEQAKSFNTSSDNFVISNTELAKYIDHTLLKPDSSKSDILRLCDEAIEYNFYSVCVNPSWVAVCFNKLKSTDIKVCTVIGFPLGANKTETKLKEAELAISEGTEELDMVINIGMLKSNNYEYVFNDIKEIAELSKKYNNVLKVIIETCLLTDEQKVIASVLCKEAGADFIKTSTGFSTSGANLSDVRLMKIAGEGLLVKASGGIKSRSDALNFLNNGVSRLGTSSGIQILKNVSANSGY
jgi:deoxyribose-phosphate aldolase